MNMRPFATSATKVSTPISQDRIARTEGRLQRNQPLMRKYEVAHLTPTGEINEFQRIAPAHPVFERAFSAFARGLIVQTENGPVAVEDLVPGDRVRTAEGEYRTLMWKGTMTVVPSVHETTRLLRVNAEAFGFNRPAHDMVLGPAAALYHSSTGVHAMTSHNGAFVPFADFVDGVSVIELTPMSPVQVFHLGFAGHERLCAGGLEMESYHPGPAHRFPLRGEMLDLFLSLFPHKRDLADFGLCAHPHLSLEDLELINAA